MNVSPVIHTQATTNSHLGKFCDLIPYIFGKWFREGDGMGGVIEYEGLGEW